MNTLRCLIVDDEPLARQGLEKYARQIDLVEVVGTAKSATQANTLLQQHTVDLLFLDIEMPGLSGLDFLRTLPSSPRVIFTTAYPEYALEGYAFNVVDYLLKPISFERFLQAVNKAWQQPGAATQQTAPDFIFVKTDRRLVKLRINDILWVEGQQNYVLIHTPHEKLMVLSTLKSLLETLPASLLLSVHKSYAVAVAHVDAIEGNEIVIASHRIPISVRRRTAVVEVLTRGWRLEG